MNSSKRIENPYIRNILVNDLQNKPGRFSGGISYKFAVISNEALLGVFDTFDEALEHALNEKKAGEFLIQQCLKDFEPVQYYNKAVFF